MTNGDLTANFWNGPFYVCVEGQPFPEVWWGDIQQAMNDAASLAKIHPGKAIRTLRLINTSKAETVVCAAKPDPSVSKRTKI